MSLPDLSALLDPRRLEVEADAANAAAARLSIEDLGRQVCAPRWVAGLWYTELIADHLAACLRYVRGQPGGIKRLAIAVPFQHGKSTIASELFPAWALGQDPSLRVVVGMYGLSEAKIKCANTRRWMSHANYLRAFDARFGPVRTIDEEGRERVDLAENGALSFRVRKVSATGRVQDLGGSYMATSLQAGLNGRPYEIGIVDDPYKDPGDGEDGAANPRKRSKVEEVFDAIFESREQARSVQVLVFTRMHPEDLMQYAVDKWAACGIPHAAIRLPAILDSEAERAPWDPRPLGCGLSQAWRPGAPEVKDAEWYRQKRASFAARPWLWETCWQQRPTRREGALFRAEWWRYFDPAEVRGVRFDNLWVSIDCAAKAGGASWTCADLWASKGAEAWKLDELRGHWDLRAFERELIRWLREWRAESCAKVIEDGGFGRYVVEDLAALDNPIGGFILQGTGGLSKEARATMVIDFVRSGLARLPNPDAPPVGRIRTDWTREHVAEWGAFPTKGRACDRVDAGVWGLQHHLDRMRIGES